MPLYFTVMRSFCICAERKRQDMCYGHLKKNNLQQPGVERIEDLKGICYVRSGALFPHFFFPLSI